MLANIAEPPYDTNGSGRPVIGMMPSVIPMFSNVWNANQQTTPPATSGPNRSARVLAIRSAPPQHHARAAR